MLLMLLFTTLTFTIGWLKQFLTQGITLRLNFNFHHRVVETATSYENRVCNDFNFHHRVVETGKGAVILSIAQSFNFHHRVVETIKIDKK